MTLYTKDIMARVPHRFPMLLIDRVIELEPGRRGVGIKCVTVNEPYFQGHFPDYPIVPGVLIIESLAQLSAVVFAEGAAGAKPQAEAVSRALAEAAVSAEEEAVPAGKSANAGLASLLEAPKDRPGYLAQVDMRFRQPVQPGDVMRLEVSLIKKMGRTAKVKAEVRVDDKIVAHGELTFA